MRSTVYRFQSDQLQLFHPPRHRPAWQKLPAPVRARSAELLAQMLREGLARRLGGDAEREACDD